MRQLAGRNRGVIREGIVKKVVHLASLLMCLGLIAGQPQVALAGQTAKQPAVRSFGASGHRVTPAHPAKPAPEKTLAISNANLHLSSVRTAPRAGTAPLGAQGAATVSPFSGNWSFLGPKPVQGMETWGPTAGRVTDMAYGVSNGQIVSTWAATAGGGVWKRTQLGQWVPMSDSAPTLAIGGIAVDPNNSSTVYASTGEDNHCGDCQLSQGVLRSTDAGSNWSLLGASTFATGHTQLGQVIVDGNLQDEQDVMVAANDGLYNSTDGGTNWTANASLKNISPNTPIRVDNIIEDRADSTGATYWASVSQHCQGSGFIAKSTDHGQTWALQLSFAAVPGLPFLSRIAMGEGRDGVRYMGLAACAQAGNPSWRQGQLAGVMRASASGIQLFTPSNSPTLFDYFTFDNVNFQGDYDNVVAVDPTDSNHVVFGGTTVVTTFDGGNNFYDIAGPYYGGPVHPDVHAIAFFPFGLDTFPYAPYYVGTDGGIWETIFGDGSDWENLNASLDITQYYSGTALDSTHMVGGAQDEGVIGRLPSGPALPIGQSLLTGDGTSTAMDPTPGSTRIYAALPYNSIYRGDSTDRTNWQYAAPCGALGDSACNQAAYFVTPMVMDSVNSSQLYTATTNVWASGSGGVPAGPAGWSQVSQDLTYGTTVNQDQDVVTSLAGGGAGVLATASFYGRVFESTTANVGGYVDITGNLPTWSLNNYMHEPWITGLAVNPSNSTEVWATVGSVAVGHVWHRWAGAWTDITGSGLPNLPVISVAADPAASTTVYVGTSAGVFVCTTCGGPTPVASWSAVGSALPNVRADSLSFSHDGSTLIAWTHGRGAWMISRGGVATNPQPSPTFNPASESWSDCPCASYQTNVGTNNVAPRTVRFTNNATTSINVKSITTTEDFFILSTKPSTSPTPASCLGQMAPNAYCDIAVTFDPATSGDKFGDLYVVDDSSPGYQALPLEAKAVDADWESLGGVLNRAPASSSNGIHQLDAFAVGSDNALYHKTFDGNAWAPPNWEFLGGRTLADPAAVSRAGGIDFFVQGTDGALWWRRYDGHQWLPWQSLGGRLIGGPAVASWGPNRLDVFVVGTDSALYHQSYDGTTWSGWASLGGKLNANPGAVSWGYGRIDVFARGTDFALYHQSYDLYGNGWSGGWEYLGGKLNSAPAAASWGPGRLDVFVEGTDTAVYHAIYNYGWEGWFYEGGRVTKNLSATARAVGLVDVFVVGTDRALWHRTTGP
jgi:hypothetical protein